MPSGTSASSTSVSRRPCGSAASPHAAGFSRSTIPWLPTVAGAWTSPGPPPRGGLALLLARAHLGRPARVVACLGTGGGPDRRQRLPPPGCRCAARRADHVGAVRRRRRPRRSGCGPYRRQCRADRPAPAALRRRARGAGRGGRPAQRLRPAPAGRARRRLPRTCRWWPRLGSRTTTCGSWPSAADQTRQRRTCTVAISHGPRSRRTSPSTTSTGSPGRPNRSQRLASRSSAPRRRARPVPARCTRDEAHLEPVPPAPHRRHHHARTVELQCRGGRMRLERPFRGRGRQAVRCPAAGNGHGVEVPLRGLRRRRPPSHRRGAARRARPMRGQGTGPQGWAAGGLRAPHGEDGRCG